VFQGFFRLLGFFRAFARIATIDAMAMDSTETVVEKTFTVFLLTL
jgi:hypothetical protein